MIEAERSPVLVRGVGDVGSAVAAVLFRTGYTVALLDEPAPAAPRRGMAFTDAVFDGAAILEGLAALRVDSSAELHDAFEAREMVPVTVAPFSQVLGAANWSAVIDARMRKRGVPERQRGMALLTIGLGPNFVAGETVDLAIETMWASGWARSSKPARHCRSAATRDRSAGLGAPASSMPRPAVVLRQARK